MYVAFMNTNYCLLSSLEFELMLLLEPSKEQNKQWLKLIELNQYSL